MYSLIDKLQIDYRLPFIILQFYIVINEISF